MNLKATGSSVLAARTLATAYDRARSLVPLKEQRLLYTPSTIIVLAMQHLERNSASSWYSGELTRVRSCS